MWKIIINSHGFTIIYPIVLVLSVVTGAIIARRTWIEKKIQWKSSGVESSVIAIYSLLLSFTFFASNNLMRDRISFFNNIKEASASLRRMSLFASDSVKDETQKYLIGYLGIMTDFNNRYSNGEKKLRDDMQNLNNQYLGVVAPMAKRSAPVRDDILILMPYFNQLNGTFYRIVDSYDERTPPLIIILLIFSSILIGILVGFLNSFNSKTHYLVPVIFIVIVALCVQSIRELDNPYIGSIQPNFTDFSNQLNAIMNAEKGK